MKEPERDRILTTLQETGRYRFSGLAPVTLAEVVDLVQTLGIDPLTVRVSGAAIEVQDKAKDAQ